MADISVELRAIMSAVYGEEVRGSIRDALNRMNNDINGLISREDIYNMTVEELHNLKAELVNQATDQIDRVIDTIPSDFSNLESRVDRISWSKYDRVDMLNGLLSARVERLSDHYASSAPPAGGYNMYHLGFYYDEDGDLCQTDKRIITDDKYYVPGSGTFATVAKAVYFDTHCIHSYSGASAYANCVRWYSPAIDKFRDTPFDGEGELEFVRYPYEPDTPKDARRTYRQCDTSTGTFGDLIILMENAAAEDYKDAEPSFKFRVYRRTVDPDNPSKIIYDPA